MKFSQIRLGDYIKVLTDYHANGSYEILKANVTLKHNPDYAIMARTLNFEANNFDSDLIFINKGEYEFLSKSKVYPEDIIMNKIANAGSVYIMPDLNKPVSLAMNLFLIRFDDSLDQRFMYYLMYLYEPYIKQYANGTATLTITKDSVRNLKFSVPNLVSQKKISRILSTYDDLVENNLKRIKLLEESARLTYEEWFLRFRIDGKKLDIDPESGLPFGWKKNTLGSLVSFYGGYAFKSKDYEEAQKYKIVTIKNVQDGHFVPNTTDTVSTIPDNIKPNQRLNNGDYIMSLTGNVGRVCLVYGENYLLNQRVVNLKPKKSIDYSFLYSMFRHKNMLTQLENISNGTAQQNLSPVNAAKIKLPIPDESSREKFNNKIKPAIDLIINLNLENQLLKEARDILLPRLMTGKINADDLDIAV